LISGRTDLLFGAVCGLSIGAAATDLLWGRIYNWLTAPALVFGLAVSAGLGGWSGLGDSLLGALAGLLLYGWMFWLRVLGGGDVKLLMALGAWGAASAQGRSSTSTVSASAGSAGSESSAGSAGSAGSTGSEPWCPAAAVAAAAAKAAAAAAGDALPAGCAAPCSCTCSGRTR
jgi:hypothetical protein